MKRIFLVCCFLVCVSQVDAGPWGTSPYPLDQSNSKEGEIHILSSKADIPRQALLDLCNDCNLGLDTFEEIWKNEVYHWYKIKFLRRWWQDDEDFEISLWRLKQSDYFKETNDLDTRFN